MESMSKIQELLQHYQLPNVNAISLNGDTILHLVVKNKKFSSKKKIEILQIFLDQSVDLNTKNRNNQTVLHLAVRSRARDIIDFLLTLKRAHETNFEHSVITCLIENESNELSYLENLPQISDGELKKWENESVSFVEWITSKDLNIKASERSPLFMAIKFGLQHMLPILFKHTTDIDKNRNLLHQFLQQFLQQSKIHRDSHEGKPTNIWYSTYFERHAKRFVNDLLDRGLSPDDVDVNGINVLSLAIELEEHIDIVEMLIDRSVNVDRKNFAGETVFFKVIDKWVRSPKSSTHYYQKIAVALIAKGADINVRNNYGYSSLNNVILFKNLQVAKFLNECGGDFNVKTRTGETLMHILLERNSIGVSNIESDIELLEMLIRKGCDVNAKDIDGVTPLHMAAKAGSVKIIQMLTTFGAHVNCQDNRGWRLLHYAAKYVRTDAADFLLKSGAFIGATNLEGQTPLHLAISVKNDQNLTSLFDILLQHGAGLKDKFFSFAMTRKREASIEWNDGFVATRSYVDPKEEYLFKHWMKLKATNLTRVNNKEYKKHIKLQKYQEYFKKCLIEVEKLKGNFIDSSISIYNFLHMNSYGRCAYINNEKLTNIIGNQVELKKNFPEYSIIILGKYRDAVTKKSLMELAKQTWFEITDIVLPDLCLECIFSFLKNSELFKFIGDQTLSS